jgi:hypothetical protein
MLSPWFGGEYPVLRPAPVSGQTVALQGSVVPDPSTRNLIELDRRDMASHEHQKDEKSMRGYLKFDRGSWIFAALFVVSVLPSIFAGAGSVSDLMFSARADEPALTECLESMTIWPFGNPANYWNDPTRAPKYWSAIGYGFFLYCGGLQQTLAFPLFAPLKLAGFPTFPIGPILLRTVSFISGLFSLIIIYNFARKHAGQLAAVFSATFVLTYSEFLNLSASAHPDMLMVLTGLVTLIFATAYAESGRASYLAGAGFFVGLTHGTKFGGPWFVPMLALALFWGAHCTKQKLSFAAIVGRGSLIATFALLGFFLATPHALFWKDYWRSLREIFSTTIIPNYTLFDWLGSIYSTQGIIISLGWLASLTFVFVQWLRGHPNQPLLLASVLGISGVLWYGINSRVIISTYYLLLPLCLFAIVFGAGVQRAVAGIGSKKYFTAAKYAAGLVFLVIFEPRSVSAVNTLLGMTFVHSPIAGNTAVAVKLIPTNSVILSDISSVPFFDLDVFPNQVLMGTVKYLDIWRVHPDYLIMSVDLAESEMYKKLREHQKLTIFDPYLFSVRLYQDLFGKKTNPQDLVQSPIPWLERVGSIGSFQTSPANEQSEASLSSGDYLARELKLWRRLSAYFQDPIPLRDPVANPDLPSHIIYRVHPMGGPSGRMGPFSSGDSPPYFSVYAFWNVSRWKSSQTGDDVAHQSFVGFDYGGGQKKSLNGIKITWSSPAETPSRAKIQLRDGEGQWTDTIEVVPVRPTAAAVQSWTEFYPIAEREPHREWRLLADGPVTSGYSFSVQHIELLEAD